MFVDVIFQGNIQKKTRLADNNLYLLQPMFYFNKKTKSIILFQCIVALSIIVRLNGSKQTSKPFEFRRFGKNLTEENVSEVNKMFDISIRITDWNLISFKPNRY